MKQISYDNPVTQAWNGTTCYGAETTTPTPVPASLDVVRAQQALACGDIPETAGQLVVLSEVGEDYKATCMAIAAAARSEARKQGW